MNKIMVPGRVSTRSLFTNLVISSLGVLAFMHPYVGVPLIGFSAYSYYMYKK